MEPVLRQTGGSLEVIDCQFLRCRSADPGSALRASVAGTNTRLLVRGCIFEGCESTAAYIGGGGFQRGDVEIVDCLFRDNRATETAGALVVGSVASSSILSSEFVGNVSQAGPGATQVALVRLSCQVRGNLFLRNRHEGPINGGGALLMQSKGICEGNTFVGNESATLGSAIWDFWNDDLLEVTGNVFALNSGGDAYHATFAPRSGDCKPVLGQPRRRLLQLPFGCSRSVHGPRVLRHPQRRLHRSIKLSLRRGELPGLRPDRRAPRRLWHRLRDPHDLRADQGGVPGRGPAVRRGLLALAGLLLPAVLQAATLRVPSEYATLQLALDASASGDTVLVAPGIYNDFEVRTPIGQVAAIGFVPPGVALVSELGSSHTVLDMSALEGAAPQVNALRVDSAPPGQETLIEGFTIRGASSSGAIGLVVRGSEDVALRESVFHVDEPMGQVAIRRGGTSWIYSSGRVEGCEFVRCEASSGAAIHQTEGTLTVINSSFRECANQAVQAANIAGTTTIEGCTFEQNVSAFGAVVTIGNGALRNSEFLGNTGADLGAAFSGVSVEVVGCLFDGNEVEGVGAAIVVTGFGNVVENNTIVRNRKVGGPGLGSAVYIGGSNQTTVRGNIIAYSSGGPALDQHRNAMAVVGECNVFYANQDGDAQGYTLRESDRVVDPQFCDVAGADWTLRPESPCLPEDSQGCDRIGAFGVGCGTVSVTPTTFGRIKAAYRDGGRP